MDHEDTISQNQNVRNSRKYMTQFFQQINGEQNR